MLGVYQKLYDTATSILPPSLRGSGDWCFYSDGNSLLHLSICTAPILFWSLGGGGSWRFTKNSTIRPPAFPRRPRRESVWISPVSCDTFFHLLIEVAPSFSEFGRRGMLEVYQKLYDTAASIPPPFSPRQRSDRWIRSKLLAWQGLAIFYCAIVCRKPPNRRCSTTETTRRR